MSQLTENITLIIKELNKKTPNKNMDDLADYIGFSQGGLYTSFVKERMKVATLEKICDFYQVSIVDVVKKAINYTKEGASALREPVTNYHTSSEYVEFLKEKLNFREQQVEYYEEELRKYKTQNKLKKSSS